MDCSSVQDQITLGMAVQYLDRVNDDYKASEYEVYLSCISCR